MGGGGVAFLSPDLIQKYTEQFKWPELFASINGQIVSVPVEPENPLRTAEMTLEDDYGLIDGIPKPRRAGPRRRKSLPSGSGWRTRNGSARNGKARTSLPCRRSSRSWATYEPEQEMASGMVVLPR